MDTVRAPRRGLDDTLEPMNSNAMIFEHMIQKARSLGLGKYLDARNGAPLRLATMCSGTESPVYALRLFRDGMCCVSCDRQTLYQLACLSVPKLVYMMILCIFSAPRSLSCRGLTPRSPASACFGQRPAGVQTFVLRGDRPLQAGVHREELRPPNVVPGHPVPRGRRAGVRSSTIPSLNFADET